MDRYSEEEGGRHSPEPWKQEGRYIRDAAGAIVVRGKRSADARRIVAAINGTRGIPTEALESWSVQDVSDPKTRPELEVDLSVESPSSPSAVSPPGEVSAEEIPEAASSRDPSTAAPTSPSFVFERRVFERRMGHRRTLRDRRKSDRRQS